MRIYPLDHAFRPFYRHGMEITDPIDLIRSKRGMFAKIAAELNLARSTVSDWSRIPAERLPEVERITGIPRHVLRPDICLPPQSTAPTGQPNASEAAE
jgi:hypothetical protein